MYHCNLVLNFGYYLVYIVVEIGFSPITYMVNENDGIVILFVENRNPEIETEVTVLFDTTDGTATSKS